MDSLIKKYKRGPSIGKSKGKSVLNNLDKPNDKNLNLGTAIIENKSYPTESLTSRSKQNTSLFAPKDFIDLPNENSKHFARRRSRSIGTDLTFGFMEAFVKDGDHSNEDLLDSEGISPLYKAAANGDIEALQWLLLRKWDINIPNIDGSTALHAAVAGNHNEVIKFLCNHNSNVDYQNKKKETAIHWACEKSNLLLVKLLLSFKANLQLRDINDEIPLVKAIRAGKLGITKFLLDNKCDPNTSSHNGRTLLHLACSEKNANAAKLLLSYNADPTIPNFFGSTPFNNLTHSSETSFDCMNKSELTEEEWIKISNFCHVIFLYCCSNKDIKLFQCLYNDISFVNYYSKNQQDSCLSISLRSKALDIAEILIDDEDIELIDIGNQLPQLIFESQSEILIRKMILKMLERAQTKKTNILDISNCQIKYISKEFIEFFINNEKILNSIQCINLKHNEIQTLPTELLDLPEYIEVKLEGNPLEMIPASQRRVPWLKTKEYLSTVRERAKHWKDCKLLMLGQESAGKSTLLQCFMSKKSKSACKINLSTNGIEFHRQVKFPIEGDIDHTVHTWKNVYFNAWDFGGQEIFYPTHRFFLTDNAVYIVTFNLLDILNDDKKKEAEARISYWMQQVRLSTINSRVKLIYLVGTHLDCVDNDSAFEYLNYLERKFPKQRFQGTEAIMAVSCKTGYGILDLKTKILKDVTSKGLLPYVPPSWVKLYDYIFPQKTHVLLKTKEKLDTNWITRKKFKLIAKKFGLEDADISTAAEFFQSIGTIILHKNDMPNLKNSVKDIIILKPQWLASVMSTLISFNHTWIKNGFLRNEDVKHVFINFDECIYEALLDLLENFSIIYRIKFAAEVISPNRKRDGLSGIFVPSLLPIDPPDEEFKLFWANNINYSEEIGRIYIFPFLPLGLIERIIVRAFHTPGFAPHYFWRNGAFLYFKCAVDLFKVFILFDPILYRLTIRMRSTKPKESDLYLTSRASIFSLLIDSIDTSLEEYKLGDTTDRLIPCSHCIDIQIKKIIDLKEKAANEEVTNSEVLSIDYSNVFEFSYSECIYAITEGDGFIFCHHIRSPSRTVSIQKLAPDIALTGVTSIPIKSLKIHNIIGKGGFGSVYKGILSLNDSEETIVAIKEANVDISEGDYIFSDFRQEVFIMSQITKHPNIIEFYGVTLTPKPRMILEFIPHGDLDAFIRPKAKKHTFKTFPVKLRLLIAWDIAKGMNSLHNQQPPIIHRDLRSPNIFMVSFKEDDPIRAKVADFGLARIITPTISGVLDTWQWLAPEVIGVISKTENRKDANGYGCSSDVYSFAICCWEIVTCKYPFQEFESDIRFCKKNDSGQVNVAITKIKRAIYTENLRPTLPPPASKQFPDRLPLGFLELIRDCWKTNPRDRPTFKEIVKRIEDLIPGFDKSKINNIRHNIQYKSYRSRTTPINNKRSRALTITEGIPNSPSIDQIDYNKEFIPGKTIRLPMHLQVSCVCVHSTIIDGYKNKEIWIGCERGVIITLNALKEGLPVITLWNAHEDRVTSITSVNNTVWSGSTKGSVAIWNNSNSLIKEWKVFRRKPYISNIYFDNSKVWISGKEQRNIKVYNLKAKILHNIPIKKTTVICSILKYRDLIWIGTENDILLYDAKTVENLGSFNAHPKFVIDILDIGNNRICTGCSNGEIAIWQVDGTNISCCDRKKEQVGQKISSLCLYNNTRVLSATSENIIVWDIEKINSVQELDISGSVTISCIVLTDKIVVLHKSGKLSIYDYNK